MALSFVGEVSATTQCCLPHTLTGQQGQGTNGCKPTNSNCIITSGIDIYTTKLMPLPQSTITVSRCTDATMLYLANRYLPNIYYPNPANDQGHDCNTHNHVGECLPRFFQGLKELRLIPHVKIEFLVSGGLCCFRKRFSISASAGSIASLLIACVLVLDR